MTVNELLTDLLRRIAQYFNLKKNPYCKYTKNSAIFGISGPVFCSGNAAGK